MRFLGVTETCDLGAVYLRLAAAGHEVKVFIGDEKARGTLQGLVPRSDDWRRDLDWVRAVGAEGVILFEAASEGSGALQDSPRGAGSQLIGGSAFADRLETARASAQPLFEGLGWQPAPTGDSPDPP